MIIIFGHVPINLNLVHLFLVSLLPFLCHNSCPSTSIDMGRGRQNIELPAGAAFATWNGPPQNRKSRSTKHELEGCAQRTVTQ